MHKRTNKTPHISTLRRVEDFIAAFGDEDRKWLAMTGVSKTVFAQIFHKYCARKGHHKSTDPRAITTPYALYQTLVFLKVYPVSDALPALVGNVSMNAAFLLHRSKERVRWLAMQLDELDPTECAELPHGMFPGAFGCVDGLPVRVQVPTDGARAEALRSGKYHTTVVKYDLIVNHEGLPLAFYGPFDVSTVLDDLTVLDGLAVHNCPALSAVY